MNSIPTVEDSIQDPASLLRALRATVRHYWLGAMGYQKLAYLTGLLLIGSAVFHTGVLLITGGSLSGPVSWRKPILFGEAFGLTAISLGWLMNFLPRRRVRGWLLMGALSFANAGEVLWVSIQQWRGVPSHFNLGTPLDTGAFATAGNLIIITAAVIVLLALWSFFSLEAPRSLRWAIRLGLLGLVISQVIGFLILQNGFSRVVDPQSGAFLPQNLATAATWGSAGAMKIPHALSLHAIQLLPILVLLLLMVGWEERRIFRVLLAAAGGYAGLLAVSLWQTFQGRAFLDLSLGGVGALIVSALLLLFAGIAVIAALRNAFDRGEPAPSGQFG